MIHLEETENGVILSVRAQPRARKEGIQGAHHGMLKVAVNAPPVDGKANQALIEVLARSLGLKKNQIELLSGATAREKRFLVRQSRSELEAALQRILD